MKGQIKWIGALSPPDRTLTPKASTAARQILVRFLYPVIISRFSFASRALALGESLSMIGRLLGHADVGTTARYAHLARDAEKVAVARVGDSIEADILRMPPAHAA